MSARSSSPAPAHLPGPDPDRDPVIVLGRRTAFGRKNGVFGRVSAENLLAPVLAAVVADAQLPPDSVDDVIIGNAVGGGGNVARLAALLAGLPRSVPGLTVDRQCGSGLEAIVLACRLVAAGAGNAYLAGGVESTSTAPLRAHRLTSTPDRPDFFDRVRFAPDSCGDPGMGEAAENVAERFGISRARQDAFALRSHRLALAATDAHAFAAEIVSGPIALDPIAVDTVQIGPAALGPAVLGPVVLGTVVPDAVTADEGPRRSLSAPLLARFPPVFRAGGTVTAGNSCADADGAAVVLVLSRTRAVELGFSAGLGFVDATVQGTDPTLLGVAGGQAAGTLLARHGVDPATLARVEFVEAFAAQVLASLDLIGVSEQRVNRQGGALAVGHPFGASGALLVLNLLRQSAPAANDIRPAAPELSLSAVSIAGGLGIAALWQSRG
ncbi:thiolase family protein [Cryobacterium frigoriphilum]|uniref:Thiolase family protein n=1 Tax=Cryobacterium frigoriphilum TaxID=1259150 RepID=A0A4R9AAB1_9MICO|nr:thiolase family protein [Cryobacterium frigoriphilum]TFD55153.1 thiolase family protein [Cryobacterium frigoriphilum]